MLEIEPRWTKCKAGALPMCCPVALALELPSFFCALQAAARGPCGLEGGAPGLGGQGLECPLEGLHGEQGSGRPPWECPGSWGSVKGLCAEAVSSRVA